MTLKLLGFKLSCAPLYKVGNINTVTIESTSVNPGVLHGWRLLLRGPTVYLVSPPGFTSGGKPHEFDAKGPRMVQSIPRSEVLLTWSLEGEGDPVAVIDKLVNWDSEPFGIAAPAPKEAKK